MADLARHRPSPQPHAGDWLRTLEPATRFILQAGVDARAIASEIWGVPLSDESCRAHEQGQRAALWLGPNEHLLIGTAGETQALAARLSSALAAVAHSLVDVSHRQIALAVSGPHAAAILNTGCPLDLDPAAFAQGMCTRTVLGKAEVVLWRKGTTQFHLEVWRSFAEYVSQWLQEAAQDFVRPA